MAKLDWSNAKRIAMLGALSLALTCAGLAASRQAAEAAAASDAYLLIRM